MAASPNGTKHSRWIEEYEIPLFPQTIIKASHDGCEIRSLLLSTGDEVEVEALFTTRGDIYYNKIARALGAQTDAQGQVRVNDQMATTVRGLYAAGVRDAGQLPDDYCGGRRCHRRSSNQS